MNWSAALPGKIPELAQNHPQIMPADPELVMNDTPLCASKRTGRSLWQQYRIYGHRLELQSWVLLHTVVNSESAQAERSGLRLQC